MNCQQDHRYQMQITEMPTAILLLTGNATLGKASNPKEMFPSAANYCYLGKQFKKQKHHLLSPYSTYTTTAKNKVPSLHLS